MALKSWLKTRIGKTLVIVGTILLILIGGAFVYLNSYYVPDAKAIAESRSPLWRSTDYGYVGMKCQETGNCAVEGNDDPPVAFYPGAKVDERSYLPFLRIIVDGGLEVHVLKMPWRMAFFDIAAADKVLAQTDKQPIILMGHSLGGAMASRYAADNPSKVQALILLGAYPYGNYDGPTLSLAGSLETSVIKKNQSSNAPKIEFITISGGNHAQFGNYGRQSGDPLAQISRERQQQQAADLILKFVHNLKK